MTRVTSAGDWANFDGAPSASALHAQLAEEVLTAFGVNPERGLDPTEVEKRRARFGPNQLPEASPPAIWRRFLGQFLEPMVAILITAAVVSGLLGDVIDTLAILAIVVLNGVIGFVQEERAERACQRLQRLSAPVAKVRRQGELRSVPARDLVPGDRIVLEAGDSVPADARLTRSFEMRTQEAALTGESEPVTKDATEVWGPRLHWEIGPIWSSWERQSPAGRRTRWSSRPEW